jgi:hypothetical protein
VIDVPVHPEFAARDTFEHLKLGRLPRRDDPRTLLLARYLDDTVALPATPPSADFASAVPSWPMYGNDRLGDCTCAAVGHMIQAWTVAAGAARTPADPDVEALYWQTGTPPAATGSQGSAQDDGRAELDVLNYWRNTGLAGDKITAYIAVDPSNLDHVRAAIYLFGGVYTGIALPLTAKGQTVWDVVAAAPDQNTPGSWGGHAVPYLAYDDAGFVCVTWGSTLRLTTAFHNEYTDEAYAIVSPDFLAASGGASPAGFNLEALEADLAELAQP